MDYALLKQLDAAHTSDKTPEEAAAFFAKSVERPRPWYLNYRAILWILKDPTRLETFILAETGQRHIIFRAPVNMARDSISVQLDTMRITYRPSELQELLATTAEIAAVIGPGRLMERPDTSAIMRLGAKLGADAAERLAKKWYETAGRPIWRLASFLTSKEKEGESE